MKKRILALFLCLMMVFALVACGGNETPSTDTGSVSGSGTDTESSVGSDTNTDEKGNAPNVYDPSIEHKFVACDIRNHSIVVFDLNACDGDFQKLTEDSAVVWEWDAEEDPNCKSADKIRTSISGVRYRYSGYYKKDVVVACATYGWVGIIDYETRSVLWESTASILNGVHSVEMLPNGDVIAGVAGIPGAVVYFAVSAGINQPVHSIDSLWCHGVCWDPVNECLWVLEDSEVYRADIKNMGTENAKIVRMIGSGTKISSMGHAFAPVGGQPGKYWASNSAGLWMFDTETEELTSTGELSRPSIKGVCSFADGTVIEVVAGAGGTNEKDFGSAGFYIFTNELSGGKVQTVIRKTTLAHFLDREFYKVQAFTKDYQ